jgi:hypothetical protein
LSKMVLLVEPEYRSKYPPLGLMKISQYHRGKGDHVEFCRGMSAEHRDKAEWDRIYVSTLFTYDWSKTIKTVKYYRYSVKDPRSENLIVGGVMATLMADDIRAAMDCKVVEGLLDEKGKLGYGDDDVIDSLLPDYSILDQVDYQYATANAYIGYMTRGCSRKCRFCAVHKMEPRFKHYQSMADHIEQVNSRYGPRKDLLLLDNNVLASKQFERIVNEIKSMGFQRGAQFAYLSKSGHQVKANRCVDFNQGLDARLLTEPRMALLSEIAVRPLRIAFDNIAYRPLYEEKVRLAARFGMRYLSNYILFNYDDRAADLYERLRINLDLNDELDLQIFSFPMRYIDLRSKNRLADTAGNLGRFWTKKQLRSIQCILLATHGVVSPNRSFFEAAFGKDSAEFQKILLMPEDYIIHRRSHEKDGSCERWWSQLSSLTSWQYKQLMSVVSSNTFARIATTELSTPVVRVLEHYLPPNRPQLSMFDE